MHYIELMTRISPLHPIAHIIYCTFAMYINILKYKCTKLSLSCFITIYMFTLNFCMQSLYLLEYCKRRWHKMKIQNASITRNVTFCWPLS